MKAQLLCWDNGRNNGPVVALNQAFRSFPLVALTDAVNYPESALLLASDRAPVTIRSVSGGGLFPPGVDHRAAPADGLWSTIAGLSDPGLIRNGAGLGGLPHQSAQYHTGSVIRGSVRAAGRGSHQHRPPAPAYRRMNE